MYKVKNTDVVVDVRGAKQIADYLLVREYDYQELPYMNRVSKKEFRRMQEQARKLRTDLDRLGESARSFPRELKTKIKKCLAAIAKLMTGRSRVEPIQDFLERLVAVPA